MLTYYVATSLDGFVAREDGRVDWLDPYQVALETPYDYAAYYQTVEAVVMGRKTYDVLKSLSVDYPYAGKPAYLFTRQKDYKTEQEEISVINKGELTAELEKIKKKHPGRVWLVGGADLAAQLLQNELVDEIALTLVPTTLGRGVQWLGKHVLDQRWELAESYLAPESIVQLIYRRVGGLSRHQALVQRKGDTG